MFSYCFCVQLGFDCLYTVSARRFSSNALEDVPIQGIVDVPLAQTGEGIAECELIRWFVQEVRGPLSSLTLIRVLHTARMHFVWW